MSGAFEVPQDKRGGKSVDLYQTIDILREYKEEAEIERMALQYDWYENVYFKENETIGEWIHSKCLAATMEVDRNLEYWIDNYNYYFDIYLDSEEGQTNNLPDFDRTMYHFFHHVAYIVHRESYYHNYRTLIAIAVYEDYLAKESTITLAQRERMEKYIDTVIETGIYQEFS